MGKASKKKRQARAQRGAESSSSIDVRELLASLEGKWLVLTHAGARTLAAGPLGAAIPLFRAPEDATLFASEASHSQLQRVGSIPDLIALMAEMGIATLVDVESGKEVNAASRIDEVVRPQPSHLVVGEPALARVAVSRVGSIVDIEERSLLWPWRRFDLIDAAIASILDVESPSPFPDHEPGGLLWEVRTPNATPMFSGAPELGPWRTRFGVFAFFSNPDHASSFFDSGVGGEYALIHRSGDRPIDRLSPVAVPCLLTRINELLPAAGYSPLLLNPGGSRSAVAIGETGKPYLRTVGGIWEVMEGNRFRFLHPWANWSRRDTLHWSGSLGVSYSPLSRSSTPNPRLGDPLDFGDEEKAQLVAAALEAPHGPPEDVLDGFLLVLQDSIDQARWTWRVFGDLSACLAWLSHYEATEDLPARISGVDPPQELGFAGSEPKSERRKSRRFSEACRRLARQGVIEPYRTQAARDLAGMSNMILKTQLVQAAGYIRDLAIEARDDDWHYELIAALGSDGSRLMRWLEETRNLPISPQTEAELAAFVGTETWQALNLKSRYFLSTAHDLLMAHGDRPDLDASAVVMEIGKALELELSELVATFRDTRESSMEHDPHDWNDQQLRGFLDGTTRLSLGSFKKLFRPQPSDSALRLAFAEHIRQLPGGDFLTSKKFADRFLMKMAALRNPASHDSPTAWSTARDVLEAVLGTPGRPGPIPALVRWKSQNQTRPQPSPAGLRFRHVGHYLEAVSFAFEAPHPTALIDPEEEEDESWLDFTFWLVGSGELDRLVNDEGFNPETADALKTLHDEARQRLERTYPSADPSLPALQRTVLQYLEDPEWDRYEPNGLIAHDPDEVVWRVIPGFLLGRTAEGIVAHFVYAHSGIEGDAYDTFTNFYDAATAASMAEFLDDAERPTWVARKGALALQRASHNRLIVLMRRSRPPGGYMPIFLGPEATLRFATIIHELAAETWGPLIEPDD